MTSEELGAVCDSLKSRIWEHFKDVQDWDSNYRETEQLIIKSLKLPNTRLTYDFVERHMTYKYKSPPPTLTLHLKNGDTVSGCPLPRENCCKRLFYEESGDDGHVLGFWKVAQTDTMYDAVFYPASEIISIEYKD